MTRVKYEDLTFEPHPVLGPPSPELATALREVLDREPRFAPVLDHLLSGDVECARAEFANGRGLSILRGTFDSWFGFETCRLVGGAMVEDPKGHASADSVQAEMDAVERLPPT